MRNLLDNLTAANRVLVDQRLVELSSEREALQQRADTLERMVLSQAELDQTVREARRFLADLPATLATDGQDLRQAALRRCVSPITVILRESG